MYINSILLIVRMRYIIAVIITGIDADHYSYSSAITA